MNTIYTLGYRASTPEAIRTYVNGLGALLVDIRYNPWSRDPRWIGTALRDWLGSEHYRYCRAYGNVNYRGEGPIKLLAPRDGAEQLQCMLERQSIILLCACADAMACHRTVAAAHLARVTGAPVVHLPGTPDGSPPENSMRCLSLTQPWASLLFVPDPTQRKCWETRSWATAYRGPIAIHASKGFPRAARDLYDTDSTFRSALRLLPGVLKADSPLVLPLGAVIGTVDVVDCRPTAVVGGHITRIERAFGDYTPGRWAWQLANPVLFPEPIPERGALGLWTWTPPLSQEVHHG